MKNNKTARAKEINVQVLEWSFQNSREKRHKSKDIWAHFVDDADFDPKNPQHLSIEIGGVLPKGMQLTVSIPVRDIEAFLRVFKEEHRPRRMKQ